VVATHYLAGRPIALMVHLPREAPPASEFQYLKAGGRSYTIKYLVVVLGLEPRLSDSKSPLLPLEDSTLVARLGFEPRIFCFRDRCLTCLAIWHYLEGLVGHDPTTIRLRGEYSTY
jgi:hypothetical protein